jgi:hypothetical protein
LAHAPHAGHKLPGDIPPGQTVDHDFRAWRNSGAWQRIYDQLHIRFCVQASRNPEASAGIEDSQVAVESQIVELVKSILWAERFHD